MDYILFIILFYNVKYVPIKNNVITYVTKYLSICLWQILWKPLLLTNIYKVYQSIQKNTVLLIR